MIHAAPERSVSTAQRVRLWGSLSVAALVCLSLACAASPRQRPLPTKPIETGAESTASTRRMLEGTWHLVSLDITAPDGRQATVDAQGRLTFDKFGNLHIEYRVSDAGMNALKSAGVDYPNPHISTEGKVAIDVQQHRITYIGGDHHTRAFDPDLAARRADPFAVERERYYVFGDDGVLRLSTRTDQGQDAAVSRWARGAQ